MADLLNVYADDVTSYKGMLNLKNLGSALTTSLQAVTDGMNVDSPLSLSTLLAKFATDLIVGGASSALGRMHVKGAAYQANILYLENEDASYYLNIKEDDDYFGLYWSNVWRIKAKPGNPMFINIDAAITFSYTGGFGVHTINDSGMSIGSSALPACAVFALTSTSRGFVLPRMTTTQKNAISTPLGGLKVFDTTLGKECVYNGSAWETVTSA